MSVLDRNPLILPEAESKRRGCPKCGHEDFNGRRVQGVITFTCASCKSQWQGGLPQEPLDPHIPMPPENPIPPPVTFSRDPRSDQIIEHRRSVSTLQEFRKGALVPPPGEEDA